MAPWGWCTGGLEQWGGSPLHIAQSGQPSHSCTLWQPSPVPCFAPPPIPPSWLVIVSFLPRSSLSRSPSFATVLHLHPSIPKALRSPLWQCIRAVPCVPPGPEGTEHQTLRDSLLRLSGHAPQSVVAVVGPAASTLAPKHFEGLGARELWVASNAGGGTQQPVGAVSGVSLSTARSGLSVETSSRSRTVRPPSPPLGINGP